MLPKLKTTVQILKLSKLFLIGFLIFNSLFFILYSTSPALAQDATTSAASSPLPTTNYQLPTYIPPTSPMYTDLLVNNLFHSFSCLAIGQSVIGQPCVTYQLTQNAQGMLQGVPVLSQTNLSGGTLGTVGSIIGALYVNPPVRTADYLASVKGFGLIKEARAQGVSGSGANVLSPIISLWQVSRNISYVVMIIIFLVIGVMVMFRNKINPQTVITAQAALPGLIIGLILITFSYFLAGLLSDMAFIGTNIVGYYFQTAQPSAQPGVQPLDNLVERAKQENVLSIFSRMTGIIRSEDAATFISSIWNFLADPSQTGIAGITKMDPQRVIQIITGMLTAQLILPFGSMFGGLGQIIGGVVATGLVIKDTTGLIGLSFSFIATAILIYSMFKLLIKLINNYITIVFLTLSAPFQFMAASLPGRQGIATGWVLNMLCNVLAFPAVMAVFYFAAFLLNQSYGPLIVSTGNTLTGTSTFPLFGGLDMRFINLLLAFGVLIASPSIPDIVCRTIGRVSQAGQLIGQEISSSTGAGRGYVGRFQQGTSGFVGQVGRLTNTTGRQYVLNPNAGVGEDRWLEIPSLQEGQIARAGRGLGGFINRFRR